MAPNLSMVGFVPFLIFYTQGFLVSAKIVTRLPDVGNKGLDQTAS